MVKITAPAAGCCSHVCGQQRGNRTGQREEFLCLSAAAGLLLCCYRPGTGPLANILSPTIPDLMDVNDEVVVGAQLRVQDARLWSWGRPCSLAHAHQSWKNWHQTQPVVVTQWDRRKRLCSVARQYRKTHIHVHAHMHTHMHTLVHLEVKKTWCISAILCKDLLKIEFWMQLANIQCIDINSLSFSLNL